MEQIKKVRGRPKGRKRTNCTLSLSNEVKRLLSNHDNASQFVEMLVLQTIAAANDNQEVQYGTANS